MTPAPSPPTTRLETPGDREAVLHLLATSLGWVRDDALDAFFSWKHEANPAGSSSVWVALDDEGNVIGVRTFLRWTLESSSGELRRVARAVDTATHADHRRRGIFRTLTSRGLDALTAEGVDFVFNTPNDQSLPADLSMGWREIGRLPTSVRASPRSLLRMARARVPASRWSEPATGGRSMAEIADERGFEELLASQPEATGLRTPRTSEHLRWRYGFEPLAYQVSTLGADVAEGIAMWRVRRRGDAREVTLCDIVVPDDDARAREGLERVVARAAAGDYVIRIGRPRMDRAGFLPLVGQGPMLVQRVLNRDEGASLDDWALVFGDIEPF